MKPVLIIVCLIAFGFSGCGQQPLGVHDVASDPGINTGGGSSITNVTRSLHNWWKLDENTGTTTAETNGSATGTLTGSVIPTWTSGIINSALNFGGSGYVQLAANTISGSSGLTVSAWIKPGGGSPTGTLFYDSNNDVDAGYFIDWPGSTYVELVITGGSGDCARGTTTGETPVGVWTHLIFTWDGNIASSTGIHIYTNGVEAATQALSDGGGTHNANTTTSRYIGSGAAPGAFVGIIDDVRVYSRVLDATERSYIYQWRGEP